MGAMGTIGTRGARDAVTGSAAMRTSAYNPVKGFAHRHGPFGNGKGLDDIADHRLGGMLVARMHNGQRVARVHRGPQRREFADAHSEIDLVGGSLATTPQRDHGDAPR